MFATMSPSFRTYHRRNALIPLPLLPPVPHNAIVTSVKIVHNTTDPVEFDNAFTFNPYTTSTGVKRGRTTRRRSTTSCPPCDATTTNDYSSSSLLNPNRKPRSTIVVTVRLANPAPATYAGRPSVLAPAPRRSATVNANVAAATSAMLARKLANKPRVSSPLASSVVTAGAEEKPTEKMDVEGVSPLSSPVSGSSRAVLPLPRTRLSRKLSSKKGTKAKTTSRIGMLRWAVLNNSSPEVGRRILSMGIRLAQEIWEAERAVEEIEVVEEMETRMQTEEQDEKEKDEHEDDDVTRVKVAEECIRELEDMEVDSEDTEMEASAPSVEAPATDKPTETEAQTMEVDVTPPASVVPVPVTTTAPVAPAFKPLQVQVQLKIAVQVFTSPSAKKVRKESERSKRWFERIAL